MFYVLLQICSRLYLFAVGFARNSSLLVRQVTLVDVVASRADAGLMLVQVELVAGKAGADDATEEHGTLLLAQVHGTGIGVFWDTLSHQEYVSWAAGLAFAVRPFLVHLFKKNGLKY